MRVFVTGGSGFVGSHVVAELVGRGDWVRMLVRSPDKATRVLAERGVEIDGVELMTGDMCDSAVVGDAASGCDATVHAAAAIGMTGRDAGDVYGVNTTGARTVIGAAVEAGHDPVLHVSSVAVFVPPDGSVIGIDSRLASPRSPYGRSKVAAEGEMRRLQADGTPVVIAYPGAVIGPGAPSLDATIDALRGARVGGWPKTVGGVALIDVRDLAAAIAAALVPGLGPRRLMLGGRYLSWAELGVVLDEVCGVRARRVPLPKPVIMVAAGALDLLRRVRSIDYPLNRDGAEMMTTMVPTDDEPTLSELGVTLRPVRDSLGDTFRWLVAAGHLDPTFAPRLVVEDPV